LSLCSAPRARSLAVRSLPASMLRVRRLIQDRGHFPNTELPTAASPLCLWLLSSIPVYHHRSSFELAASAAACSILPSCCCFLLSTLVVSSSPFSTPRARSRIARALPAAVLRDHRYSEVTSLSTELFYLLASRTERPIPPVLSALSAVAARATRALPFVMPRARPL